MGAVGDGSVSVRIVDPTNNMDGGEVEVRIAAVGVAVIALPSGWQAGRTSEPVQLGTAAMATECVGCEQCDWEHGDCKTGSGWCRSLGSSSSTEACVQACLSDE